MRSNAARAYSLLFFFSGATGLVYELLWVRILYHTFGSTIQSITTVVAAYMGGLGLGAWLLGRKADRHPRPAALYGWLEIAIGAFGLASPFVLSLAHRVYIGTAGTFALGSAASVALRFGLAALVLLVPTTLMGGTLPALTKGFMGVERDRLQTSLGRLYALNTLGAVVGTALAGFFLIERVGIHASLYATAALNLTLGAAARALAPPLTTLFNALDSWASRSVRSSWFPRSGWDGASRSSRISPRPVTRPGPPTSASPTRSRRWAASRERCSPASCSTSRLAPRPRCDWVS